MKIFYFLIIIGILLIIAELLSIALRLTGLDGEKSRFQVVSIITSTGFTTRESELIVQHPTRRKMCELLMLISYVGQATIIGLILSMVTRISEIEGIIQAIGVIVAIVMIMLILRKNKWVLNRIEKAVEKRVIFKSKINKYKTVDEVLKLNEEYGVVEFLIESENHLNGKKLLDSGLKQKEIQVLNIEKGDVFLHFPKKDSVFQEGDRVVVYGNLVNIKNMIALSK